MGSVDYLLSLLLLPPQEMTPSILSCCGIGSLPGQMVLHELLQRESFSQAVVLHRLLWHGSFPWEAVSHRVMSSASRHAPVRVPLPQIPKEACSSVGFPCSHSLLRAFPCPDYIHRLHVNTCCIVNLVRLQRDSSSHHGLHHMAMCAVYSRCFCLCLCRTAFGFGHSAPLVACTTRRR